VTVATKPQAVVRQVKRRYELLLNSNLTRAARYATLVHELGHLYCGHLGTPQPKWRPDRRGLPLEIREFEAESVCYLVCMRLGIENPSAEYLAAYVREYETTPPISLDAVMKSSWLIEQMGRNRLKLRTESKN
jgi:antirestriction protein ArdC